MREPEHVRRARARARDTVARDGRPTAQASPWPEHMRGDADERDYRDEPPRSDAQTRRARNEAAASYQPFPLAALPEPARGYVDACAAAIGCDPAYVALPVLSVLAGAIGNTRRIALKRGWSEPCILWCAIVGESGTMKSPALDHAREFPRRRQAQAMKRHRFALAEYENAMLAYQADLLEWKRRQGDRGEPPRQPDEPSMERSIIDDATIEAVAPILMQNWRGGLILKDELGGWVGGFDRYAKPRRGGGEAAKWIEMHGGRPVIIDRKTGTPRTIYIPRAAVTVCGGIQPGILRRLIGQEERDNGLLARLLMAYPPRRPRRWTEAEPAEQLTAALERVYGRLWELAPTTNDDGEPAPALMDLTAEAKAMFIEFVNAHGAEQFELDGDLAAAWSKLEGYAARLALLHQLVRCAHNPSSVDCDRVDADSMTAGITLARWFGGEDRRIYAALEETVIDTDRRELVELIPAPRGDDHRPPAATGKSALPNRRSWGRCPDRAGAGRLGGLAALPGVPARGTTDAHFRAGMTVYIYGTLLFPGNCEVP